MSGDERIETPADALVHDDRRMLALLMDNLPGMVYRCRNDADWSMEFVSQGCQAVTGYLPEDLVHNNVISFGALIVEADRQIVYEAIQAALAEMRPYQLQYRLKHRELGLRWVWEQGRGVFAPDGALLCLEGYITDVTRSMVALERLEQSETQFRRLAENALDVIFRYDLLPEPHLAYVSPSIEMMTGYTVEEYYADRYKLHMLSLPEEWEKVHRILSSKDDNSGPLLIRWHHRDGSLIWTEQRVSVVRDEAGRVISAEGVIRDITERMRIEDALKRKMAEEAALVEMSRAILDPQIGIDQVAQIC